MNICDDFIRETDCGRIDSLKIVPASPFIFKFLPRWRDVSSAILAMGLGTKNRQNQTADLCKEHLRSTYESQRGLVEDFILEIEGSGKSRDVLQWGQFTNMDRNPAAMLSRLDEKFNRWLDGDV